VDGQDVLDAYHQLTARQRTVLDLLCRGCPRAEIAERLAVKPRLVDADLAAIYRAFALDASGLTPAQRRLELRRAVRAFRKLEQQGAPGPPAAPAQAQRPEEEASPPAAPEATEAAEAARPPITIMRRPAPIPAPPLLPAPWRWWSLAALVVLLIVLVGAWRATHSPAAAPGAAAVTRQASTSGTTSAQPAIATPPAPTPTTAPTARALPPTPTALTPTPAPSPAANATPLALAGKVASARPGTPLRLGQAVTSIIDRQAKPDDLYAVQLKAGQTLHVQVTASSDAFGVVLAAPGAQDLLGEPGIPLGTFLCNFQTPCQKDFPVAADGTYTLVVGTDEGAGVRYTLRATTR